MSHVNVMLFKNFFFHKINANEINGKFMIQRKGFIACFS